MKYKGDFITVKEAESILKSFIKETCEGLLKILIILLLIVFSPIILIWIIISTIKDYIKYKKSEYFEDTHERYSFLCADSYHISFYNATKKANLPIDFYRKKDVKITGYGYFIYHDALILCDYDSDTLYFDKEKDEWTVYDEHGYVSFEPEVEQEIKNCNEFLEKDVCKRAIVLVESEFVDEAPEKEHKLFEFLPVADGDKVSTLKNIIV